MPFTLIAKKRTEIGKRSQALLETGVLPAVVYGPKQPSIPVQIPAKEFGKILEEAGESSVIELSGVSESPLQVLIKEVGRDPVTGVPRHADFYAIEKGAKVEVAVPIEFIGESPAVKAGANLVKVLHEMEIEAAPADLPPHIEADISVLAAVGDQISVGDLKLPRGVELKVAADEIVALIQEVKEEVEEAPAAIDMDAIEVEQKGKEEGAEGASVDSTETSKE